MLQLKAKEFEPIKVWWNNRTESDVAWKVDISTIIDRQYDLDIHNPNKVEYVHEYTTLELMSLLDESFTKSQDLLCQLKEAVK